MPDATGRSRGRGAVIAWAATAIVLAVNGASMLGFAGGVDDRIRPAVLALGTIVLLLGGLAAWRAVWLFRSPPS